MSDQLDTRTTSTTQSQSSYATQPNAFRPNVSANGINAAGGAANGTANSSSWAMQPMVLVTVLALLVGALVYQQSQIGKLTNELGQVNDNLKSSDVRDRLDAQQTQLQELNNRLSYLDSKISATDNKAQIALNKLKVQEDNDFFGNTLKAIKHTFGIQ